MKKILLILFLAFCSIAAAPQTYKGVVREAMLPHDSIVCVANQSIITRTPFNFDISFVDYAAGLTFKVYVDRVLINSFGPYGPGDWWFTVTPGLGTHTIAIVITSYRPFDLYITGEITSLHYYNFRYFAYGTFYFYPTLTSEFVDQLISDLPQANHRYGQWYPNVVFYSDDGEEFRLSPSQNSALVAKGWFYD